MLAPFETHEVLNQSPPLEGYNLYAGNIALREGVRREGAKWADRSLSAFGELLGKPETMEFGHLANRHTPILKTFDLKGRRRDEVEFHPAWHRLMAIGCAQGLHSGPWADPRPGAHVARAAAFMLFAEVEQGALCPLTMTFGSVPALRRFPQAAGPFLERILKPNYDPRFRPIAEKTGALVGMGMTEKQGGSDVRTNTTRAEPAGDGAYAITGHKWFFSAPMCDGFLVLAQAPRGLSCFFLPRFRPDGSLNAIRIQRLKDKVGNKSNASSEVEFHAATGWLLGEEGRGVPTILEMGTYTRLDCGLGTTGIMRACLAHALHHAAHRTVFQKKLVDQPLMRNVLADIALEVEAATACMLRLARAFDAQADEGETLFRRLMTPAAKYWICKRGPGLAAEAMEVLGGNGYVEEGIMGRLYREMPVNSIWEGSGNVMCLDVLRALGRSPETRAVLAVELAQARGADRRLDQAMAALQAELEDPAEAEARARRTVERLMLVFQASLLVRHAPSAVADAFIQSRIEHDAPGHYGVLPRGVDLAALVQRAAPLPL